MYRDMAVHFNRQNLPIDKVLHRVLKKHSADTGKGMSDIANEAIAAYLRVDMGKDDAGREIFQTVYARSEALTNTQAQEVAA
jgi:hypothetical protein